MSATGPSGQTPKRTGAWDDAEKLSFLLKIIQHVGGGDLSSLHIKFAEIDHNGRTPKALSEMWGKMKKAGAAGNTGGAAASKAKATPKATPMKRKGIQ